VGGLVTPKPPERLDGKLFGARRIAQDAHDNARDVGVLLAKRRLEVEGKGLGARLDRFAGWRVHTLITSAAAFL
jgi:hypothetical protein